MAPGVSPLGQFGNDCGVAACFPEHRDEIISGRAGRRNDSICNLFHINERDIVHGAFIGRASLLQLRRRLFVLPPSGQQDSTATIACGYDDDAAGV